MLLSSIFFILLITLIVLAIFKIEIKVIEFISINVTGFVLYSCYLLYLFGNYNTNEYQYVFSYNFFNLHIFNFILTWGLDITSIWFCCLTSVLIYICIYSIRDYNFYKNYILVLLSIEILLIFFFSVLDLFIFYVVYEALLIPMFILIGFWGSRERKVRAAYLLFFYTILGSILFLIALLYIYSKVGTFNIEFLYTIKFSFYEQLYLWIAFFISFASKIPMFPFHIWLPEAHVEAPTIGSILLAGILLKLGVFGFLRYSLILFPEASLFYSPFVYTLSVLGIIYSSLNSIRQTDLKRIVAYSSIAHMNLVVIGLFSFNIVGLEGAIMQSISHGFVSGALFFLIGCLYNRYHTRFLLYFSGLVHLMPIYSSFFLLFVLSNIALPGTSSFIGEFLLLLGVFKVNILICIFSAISVVLSGAYSLWFYNRIIFGELKNNYTLEYLDTTSYEFSILIFLSFFVILFGIYPNFFLKSIHYFTIQLFFYFN